MKIVVLLAALVAWIGAHTDYPLPELAPSVEVVEAERLWHMLHPGEAFVPDQGEVFGLHFDGTGRILLSDTLDLDTAWGQSVLLHELVHYYQDAAGQMFPCLGAREREAYELQQAWLEEGGASLWDHVDPLYTMFVWQAGCGPGFVSPEGVR